MIKTTLERALSVIPCFNPILNKSFDASISFKIARLVRELSKEYDLFDSEKAKLVKRYGAENGDAVIDKLKVDEFNKQMSALVKTEIEINADKIPMGAFDGVEITPIQGCNLIDFIE